jgi:hypothetical protein
MMDIGWMSEGSPGRPGVFVSSDKKWALQAIAGSVPIVPDSRSEAKSRRLFRCFFIVLFQYVKLTVFAAEHFRLRHRLRS